MDVPFIDLGPVVELVADFGAPKFSSDWSSLFHYILTRHEFIGKESVAKLEARLCEQLGVNHAVVVANGTDALVLALRARGIGRGDVVGIPNLTFWATYEAVVTVGAIPVLFDIDEHDLQLSFDELKWCRRPLKALILVHLFGWTSTKLNDFRTFCSQHDIALIEDGAQAFGVEFDGESVFKHANLATLSFHPAKVIGGIGDGGAVVTSDKRVADYVRLLANHGRTDHYVHSVVGTNSRMSGIEAAWLLRVLDVSEEILANRREALAQYVTLYMCMDQKNFHLVRPPQGVTGNGYLAVIKTQPRADTSNGLGRVVALQLEEHNIGCGRIYPMTIDGQPGERHAFRSLNLEVSRAFAQDVVNLPLYYGIPPSHQVLSWRALVDVTEALK